MLRSISRANANSPAPARTGARGRHREGTIASLARRGDAWRMSVLRLAAKRSPQSRDTRSSTCARGAGGEGCDDRAAGSSFRLEYSARRGVACGLTYDSRWSRQDEAPDAGVRARQVHSSKLQRATCRRVRRPMGVSPADPCTKQATSVRRVEAPVLRLSGSCRRPRVESGSQLTARSAVRALQAILDVTRRLPQRKAALRASRYEACGVHLILVRDHLEVDARPLGGGSQGQPFRRAVEHRPAHSAALIGGRRRARSRRIRRALTRQCVDVMRILNSPCRQLQRRAR